jgi:CDP-diacylglycerol--serine O-phosphatidyltransferase
VLVLFVVVSSDPPVALFGLFVAYAISGYVLWGWRAIHGQPGGVSKPRSGGAGNGSGSGN